MKKEINIVSSDKFSLSLSLSLCKKHLNSTNLFKFTPLETLNLFKDSFLTGFCFWRQDELL